MEIYVRDFEPRLEFTIPKLKQYEGRKENFRRDMSELSEISTRYL